MADVQVHDKTFTDYLSESEIQARVEKLGKEIGAHYGEKDLTLLIVLKGAFVFAADLMRHFGRECETHFIRISSYGDEMESSGVIREAMGLEISMEGRNVLIVEDIVDTGKTLAWLRETLAKQNPSSIKTASLLFKEEAFRGDTPPEFVGFKIPNDFVVGYGLDYAEKGRELSAIYQLKP